MTFDSYENQREIRISKMALKNLRTAEPDEVVTPLGIDDTGALVRVRTTADPDMTSRKLAEYSPQESAKLPKINTTQAGS